MFFFDLAFVTAVLSWWLARPAHARTRRDGVSGETETPVPFWLVLIAAGAILLGTVVRAARDWPAFAGRWPDVLASAALGAVLGLAWPWLWARLGPRLRKVTITPFRAAMAMVLGGCVLVVTLGVHAVLAR
jgi:hypothetical protein